MPLSEAEIELVMAYPDDIRQIAWLTLLRDNKVTIDMIREAEGLEPHLNTMIPFGELRPIETDDEPFFPPPVGLDLTSGPEWYAWRLGQAIGWVLLLLGIVTALRLISRVWRD